MIKERWSDKVRLVWSLVKYLGVAGASFSSGAYGVSIMSGTHRWSAGYWTGIAMVMFMILGMYLCLTEVGNLVSKLESQDKEDVDEHGDSIGDIDDSASVSPGVLPGLDKR